MKKTLLTVAACLMTHLSAFAASALRDTNLIITELVSGLNSPTTMAFIGPNDILVLQKNDGKVLRIVGNLILLFTRE
jgi:aldose sugar dehydrogenase